MDTTVKKENICYQVLFNRPLLKSENEYLYGFRINYFEAKRFSIELLQEYLIEQIFGKCLFQNIHNGTFEGERDDIFIDQEGNKYYCGDQTKQYSYDATVENMINYRCDLISTNLENEGEDNYWITDPEYYFEQRVIYDTDDMKQGKNQWLENYLRILSRRNVLSERTAKRSEILDYETQERIKKEKLVE